MNFTRRPSPLGPKKLGAGPQLDAATGTPPAAMAGSSPASAAPFSAPPASAPSPVPAPAAVPLPATLPVSPSATPEAGGFGRRAPPTAPVAQPTAAKAAGNADKAKVPGPTGPARLPLWRALGAYVASGAIVAALILGASPLTYKLAAALPPALSQDPVAMTALFTALLYGAMAIIAVCAAAVDGVNAVRLGDRKRRGLVEGSLLGVGAMIVTIAASIALGIAKPAGLPQVSLLLLAGFAVTIVQAGGEEIFFRGWVQPVLTRAISPTLAIVLTSALFAVLHILGGATDPLAVANLFLGGLLFGALRYRSGGLLAPIAGHVLWNSLEDQLFGLTPNPGVGVFGAALDMDLVGPAWLGGGDAGLNASVQMSIGLALAIAVLVVLGIKRLKKPAPNRSGPAPS